MSTPTLLAILAVLLVLALVLYWIFRPKPLSPLPAFRAEWHDLLVRHVNFYRELSAAERNRFDARVQQFLQQVVITGIETEIEELDRILVAASGIIPTFGFPQWNHYPKLNEVLVYRTYFRQGDFSMEGPDRRVAGMVGGGFLNGKLLLSKPALRQGFLNAGRGNTGIHEFVHLLDKADGDTDGIPRYFIDHAYVIPWVEMIRQQMVEIEVGESDIDAYALTNKAEFFAVAAEYFFNRPAAFADKHPELYGILEKVFQQDLDDDGLLGEPR
ncbi:MAG: zinc-dependent peptidase [Bacteroidota bacterium]